jgi:hypothetical protein
MLSRSAYLLIVLVTFYLCFGFSHKWRNTGGESPIGWDVATYYWYIPSVIIYKDLKYQKFADSILTKYHPFEGGSPFSKCDNGSYVLTYTCGMAFMYLPSFIIAHLLAQQLGYTPDGFSLPYRMAMQVGCLFFALIGLWYYRKLLLLYFEDKIVAILLLVLALGTAYLNYSAIDGPMTHCWLFGIYALLLLNTHHFYLKPSYTYAIRIGILCGVAILIRPSEIICVLIPLLWGMESLSRNARKQKWAFLKQHSRHLIIATICIVCIGSIQLFYWKYISGHWLVYSYGADKTFSWLAPHIDSYVFSYKSGWLRYCPVMLFAILGIRSLIKRGQNKVAILTFSIINLYIISSWDIWWYAGIPARAMIQGYAILLFPFGYYLQSLFTKRTWFKWLAGSIMVLFCYINIWLVINAHMSGGLFDSNCMTKAYYMRVVGRWNVNPDAQKLKDIDVLFEGEPSNMKMVYSNNFENDSTITPKYEAINGRVSDYIEKGREYSQILKFKLDKGDAKWLRVQATYHSILKEWDIWKMPQLAVKFIHNGEILKDNALCVHRFLNDYQTKEIYLDVIIPDEPFDRVEVFMWNRGSDLPLLYDDIKVWSFNE